jgi:hypothetical protein
MPRSSDVSSIRARQQALSRHVCSPPSAPAHILFENAGNLFGPSGNHHFAFAVRIQKFPGS